MKHFFLLLILFSCGKKHDESDFKVPLRIDNLRARYEEGIQKAKDTWDKETGWPDKDDCDATLWAGLGRASGVSTVQLDRAKQADGKIHRRPGEPCWKDGKDLGAKSTISKDMLLGYVYGMWRASDSSNLSYLFSYGRDHNWVMGDPFPEMASRVVLTPNGIATLCIALRKLGGEDRQECKLPTIFASGSEDFEKHLAALGILLFGEVAGEIPSDAFQTLKDLAKENTRDALFQAAFATYDNGDFSTAVNLLLDGYVYPSYVRSSPNYELVHWLFTANLILRKY